MVDTYSDHYNTITDEVISLLQNDIRLNEVSDNQIYKFGSNIIPQFPAIVVQFDRFESEEQDWGDNDSDRTVEETIYHIITIYVKGLDLPQLEVDITNLITDIKNIMVENETINGNVSHSQIISGDVLVVPQGNNIILRIAELTLVSWKQIEISYS